MKWKQYSYHICSFCFHLQTRKCFSIGNIFMIRLTLIILRNKTSYTIYLNKIKDKFKFKAFTIYFDSFIFRSILSNSVSDSRRQSIHIRNVHIKCEIQEYDREKERHIEYQEIHRALNWFYL